MGSQAGRNCWGWCDAARSVSRQWRIARRAARSAWLAAGRGALGTQAEQLHRVAHVGETGLRGHPLGPLLHRAALYLHAPAACPARQVVVVHAGPALPVERLAAGVAYGVDAALLAER